MSPVVRIVLWCNGSTAVFGSACLGSNPGKTTGKVRRNPVIPMPADFCFFNKSTREQERGCGKTLGQSEIAVHDNITIAGFVVRG